MMPVEGNRPPIVIPLGQKDDLKRDAGFYGLLDHPAAAKRAGPLPVPRQWPATLSLCVFQSKILHYLIVTTLPISVPITSPEITISTRRFVCRPAAVSLVATG